MIKSVLIDPYTNVQAEVADGEERNALVVATRPLKRFENDILFFVNEDYGIDMNQDASAGGTPEPVHDGTDTAIWTASDIVGGGKTTFNSLDQAHTGTLSVKVDNSPVGDIFQFSKGSDLDCTGYLSLSMWIYSDKDWKLGDVITMYGWDTGTNQQVGTAIDLKNYFNYGTFDIWQKLSIPLSDFGALASSTTLDALRVEIVAAEGKSPKFYMDDIQFEQTGTPIGFCIKPTNQTWLHVYEFTFSAVAALPATLADGTMPYLPYDSLLGVSLINGLNYKREQEGIILFSNNIKSMIELMGLAGTEITGQGSDGTNTWVTVRARHIEPFILKPENEDELCFTISEDFSAFKHLRISAGCKIEYRTNIGWR